MHAFIPALRSGAGLAWAGGGLGLVLLLLWGGLAASAPLTAQFGDKPLHLAGFAALGAYAALAPTRALRFGAFALALAFAFGLEAAQDLLTSSRDAEIEDLAVSIAGAMLGFAAVRSAAPPLLRRLLQR